MAVPLRRLEGKYQILEKFKEGGMGAIYRVRHRLLGDERVVKILRPQLEDDPGLRLRFEREARNASRLSHPNIAQLYDFTIDEEGVAYIVMEYIRGWTLEELLAHRGQVPLGLMLEIARQSLDALGNLHAHGMVHRDISPDNLMLSRDISGRPRVKLIDLGIAKSMTTSEVGLTAAGMFVGKLRYASPEQINDPGGQVSPESDLYSLGLVLYELATGRFPITGDTPTSIIAGHLFRPPLDFAETDPARRVPEAVREAVSKALAKEAQERYGTARSFAAALAPARRDGDLATAEVEEILTLTLRQRTPEETSGRGTTQTRLDQHFDVRQKTPPPAGKPPLRTAEIHLQEALEHVVPRIETAIERGRLKQAEKELTAAVATLGHQPKLEKLRHRIARARRGELSAERQGDRASRADSLVKRARTEARNEDFTAARNTLSEAVELAPDHPEAMQLTRSLETVMAARDTEGDALKTQTGDIRRLLAARRPAEAMKQLNEALARFGDHSELLALRYETAQAFLESDISDDDTLTTSPVDPKRPAVLRGARQPPRASAPPAAVEATYVEPATPSRGPSEITLTGNPLAAPEGGAGAAAASRPQAEAAGNLGTEELGFAPLTDEDEEVAGEGEPAPGSPLKLWLIVAAAVILSLLLGMWIARQDSPPATDPQLETQDVDEPEL